MSESWPRSSRAAPPARCCASGWSTGAAGAPGWPWMTFAVNVAGAFLLGYFVTRLQERLPLSAYRRPLLGTGLLRRADDVLDRCRSSCWRCSTRTATGSPPATLRASIVARLRRGPPRDRARPPRPRTLSVTALTWLARGGARRLGALLRFLLDGDGRRAGRRGFPVRHARGQPQRRVRCSACSPARAERRRAAARRHRDDRLLHDVLDLDARDPAPRRGRRASGRRSATSSLSLVAGSRRRGARAR